MNLLERTISEIIPPVTDLSAEINRSMTSQSNMDFGRLNDVLLRYINITGERHPAPPQTSVVISCADHGVAAESVSAYPPETTLNMMCNYLIARGGAANAAANYANANLIVADLGVNTEHTDIPGLLHHSIARGTANMTKGPAMTRVQAIQSIETGIAIANDCATRGDRCILPGEMGISNTTSSASMVAAFLGLTPEEVTGRGANISDARLAHKVEIVRRALDVNRPNLHDGLDVLAKVGGFELGCIAGLILGAAARRMLVILDGANTTSAALVAHALAPNCVHYLLASHASLTEHSHPHALRHLGLTPMLRLDIRLSEAAGSSIVLRMLAQMLKVWETIDTSPEEAIHRPPIGSLCSPLPPLRRGKLICRNAMPPPPNQSSMSACQYRLDNLAKPIHSLGYLERIAVQLASVMHCERPPLDTQAALLLITEKKELPVDLTRILNALTDARGIPVHILSNDSKEAYAVAYQLARTHPLLILGAYEQEDCTPITDALHGAAAGGSLVLPGDAWADDIAHKTEEKSPALAPYILHVLPDMLTIDTELTAGIEGLLALDIVHAALHVVNDMKTFTETGVAVAIDGAGAGRQVREQAKK
mgnify:CR=1 FL=1